MPDPTPGRQVWTWSGKRPASLPPDPHPDTPSPGPQPLSTPLAPRDHKLTMLLREALATTNCRATMIAHVSDAPVHHAETLSTVQLAARVHRLRRKVKVGCISCPRPLPAPAQGLVSFLGPCLTYWGPPRPVWTEVMQLWPSQRRQRAES